VIRSSRRKEALTRFRFPLFNWSLLTSAATRGRKRCEAPFGALAGVHLNQMLIMLIAECSRPGAWEGQVRRLPLR